MRKYMNRYKFVYNCVNKMATKKLSPTQCSRLRSAAKSGGYVYNPITKRKLYATSAVGKALIKTCRQPTKAKNVKRGKARKITNKPTVKKFKADRPSPGQSATLYPAGKRMVGNDGGMWMVKVSSNGVHRWVRAN